MRGASSTRGLTTLSFRAKASTAPCASFPKASPAHEALQRPGPPRPRNRDRPPGGPRPPAGGPARMPRRRSGDPRRQRRRRPLSTGGPHLDPLPPQAPAAGRSLGPSAPLRSAPPRPRRTRTAAGRSPRSLREAPRGGPADPHGLAPADRDGGLRISARLLPALALRGAGRAGHAEAPRPALGEPRGAGGP